MCNTPRAPRTVLRTYGAVRALAQRPSVALEYNSAKSKLTHQITSVIRVYIALLIRVVHLAV